jgi:hypothetical protein
MGEGFCQMSQATQLLVGAKAIAAHVFGSERHFKKVYPLKGELGLFYLGGQLCGRASTIEEQIKSLEAASVAAAAQEDTS